ncbi:hypothetical protein ACIBCN_05065 [Nocardia sp. NPDC051052]|uniref:hypothetical protein n=1 Tax=Nocardia sp. NPDC051052 TaxID=3364322 RepID=UPI00379DA9BC
MVTIRNYRHSALVLALLGAMGLAITSAATPTLADNAIDIRDVSSANVGVDYSCEASAGVVGIKAMVGDPYADRPSATGSQNAVICDGTGQSTVVNLDAPLSAGQAVQIRVALVDRDDNVVSGQAKATQLG